MKQNLIFFVIIKLIMIWISFQTIWLWESKHGNSQLILANGDRIKLWTDCIQTWWQPGTSVQYPGMSNQQQNGGWTYQKCWVSTTSLYNTGRTTLIGVMCLVKYILNLSLIHIWRCRRYAVCRSRWSPYH